MPPCRRGWPTCTAARRWQRCSAAPGSPRCVSRRRDSGLPSGSGWMFRCSRCSAVPGAAPRGRRAASVWAPSTSACRWCCPSSTGALRPGWRPSRNGRPAIRIWAPHFTARKRTCNGSAGSASWWSVGSSWPARRWRNAGWPWCWPTTRPAIHGWPMAWASTPPPAWCSCSAGWRRRATRWRSPCQPMGMG